MVNGNGISKAASYAATSPGKTSSSGIPDVEMYGIICGVVATASLGIAVAVKRKRK